MMRMFRLFKKKEMTHSQKVEAAYRRYNADERKSFFPEGLHQADIIVRSLAKVYGVSLDALDENGYYDILTSYTEAIIRKVIPESDDAVIVRGFQVRHGSLVRTIEMARRAFTYTMLNRMDRSFAIESEEDMLFLCKAAQSEHEKTSKKQGSMFGSGYCFEGPLSMPYTGNCMARMMSLYAGIPATSTVSNTGKASGLWKRKNTKKQSKHTGPVWSLIPSESARDLKFANALSD